MRNLFLIIVNLALVVSLLAGCASTGKQVRETVYNVYEYGLNGDEYCRW